MAHAHIHRACACHASGLPARAAAWSDKLTPRDHLASTSSTSCSSSTVEQTYPQPLLPSAVPRDDSRGGYNCEFVQPPPSSDIVQTECPVCLQILRKPCLISCTCGQKYCEECIELLSKNNKPCPLCNKPKFNFIREYALERYLKDLDVWCSYKEVGCEWRGKLREFEVHLNQGSSYYSDTSVECQFIAVECNHKCGEWFQRRHVNIHKTHQCKKLLL